uniref:Uncharacterized protein n=1 Tax=Rhizophora mucronata TaxID=61149 RepID=A0A2P2N0H2_RHIMU
MLEENNLLKHLMLSNWSQNMLTGYTYIKTKNHKLHKLHLHPFSQRP